MSHVVYCVLCLHSGDNEVGGLMRTALFQMEQMRQSNQLLHMKQNIMLSDRLGRNREESKNILLSLSKAQPQALPVNPEFSNVHRHLSQLMNNTMHGGQMLQYTTDNNRWLNPDECKFYTLDQLRYVRLQFISITHFTIN